MPRRRPADRVNGSSVKSAGVSVVNRSSLKSAGVSIVNGPSWSDMTTSSSSVWRRLRDTSGHLRRIATESVLVRPDESCGHCRCRPFCSTHRSFTLLHRDQIDKPMWKPYLHHGYRPTEMPHSLYFKSIFQLSNETINIWSHLLGFVYFTWCQVYDNWTCMLLSALYHVFGCTSEPVRQWWLALDVMGISCGLMGMYLSGVYTAFYCFPVWLRVYMCLFCLVMTAAFLAPIHDDYMRPKFCNQSVGYYHIVYAAVVLYGIVPSVHWIWLAGGTDAVLVVRFFPNVLIVYGLFSLAFLFYALNVPERWKPGHFDLIGWSHQWWHLLILAAMVWWRNAGFVMLHFLRNYPNVCHV